MGKNENTSISPEDFANMSRMLLLPVDDAEIMEKTRTIVENWYTQMLPFVQYMADHSHDEVIPAHIINVR